MAEESGDHFVISLIVTIFAIGVSALLYYWPFPAAPLLDSVRKKVKIVDIVQVSPDVKRIRCSNGDGLALGLPVGKTIRFFAPNPETCLGNGTWNGTKDKDEGAKEIARTYTPINSEEKWGYFDLLVKVYRPGKVVMPDGKEVEWKDGGKMSLYMDSRQVGDYLEIQGPVGLYQYLGRGMWKLPGKTLEAKRVAMMAGGSGITPMLQILRAALNDKKDTTEFSLIYANKTEDDILAREQLDDLVDKSSGYLKVTYTLDHAPKDWTGRTGFIDVAMIKQCLPAAKLKPLVLMCGPPAMIELACKKSLESTGHDKQLWVTM